MVSALSGAIAAYEVMIPRPRVALNIRKNATEALDRLFSEIDTPLNIMDGLMETLLQTQPVFFETYTNARIIVNSSNAGSGVKGTVKDGLTGAPLRDVSVTINARDIRSFRTLTKTTNIDGNYEIRRIRSGSYTLTISKEGYVTQEMAVTITEGRITDADIALLRV
jgi:hypothetical protein